MTCALEAVPSGRVDGGQCDDLAVDPGARCHRRVSQQEGGTGAADREPDRFSGREQHAQPVVFLKSVMGPGRVLWRAWWGSGLLAKG